MKTKIGGRTIGFDIQGQGTPLLLMHAFPLDRAMFEQQLDALSKTVRVLTFDAPGMGESEAAPVSIDGIADLAARLLDEQKIDKAIVGGVSMGGYASFAFAWRHPDRLLGLILADTKPEADSDEAIAGRREMAKVAREQGAAEIAKRMTPKLLGATTLQQQPQVVEQVRRMIEKAAPESIAQLLEALAGRADSTGLLAAIQVPTLVIAGEEDAIIPAAGAKLWTEQIPAARFVLLPKTGHLPNIEAPGVFNQAVEEFLRESMELR
jgi:3-oxoadipate enol-lactonase